MTLCYFWLIVFPGFQIYSILYTIYIPKQEIPENYLANRKTKNNTQLQEEWIRRKYVVPVNIMESENNLIVENAIGGKNYYVKKLQNVFQRRILQNMLRCLAEQDGCFLIKSKVKNNLKCSMI